MNLPGGWEVIFVFVLMLAVVGYALWGDPASPIGRLVGLAASVS